MFILIFTGLTPLVSNTASISSSPRPNYAESVAALAGMLTSSLTYRFGEEEVCSHELQAIVGDVDLFTGQ